MLNDSTEIFIAVIVVVKTLEIGAEFDALGLSTKLR